MTTPQWLIELEEALQSRAGGAVLTFNTGDRVYLGDEQLAAASLRFAIASRFIQQGYQVGYYSMGTGFEVLNPPWAAEPKRGSSPFGRVPREASPLITLTAIGPLLRRGDSPVMMLLDHADHLAPRAAGHSASQPIEMMQLVELLYSWGQDDNIKATNNFVVLVSHENAVSPLLTESGAYRVIRIDLPDETARRSFAADLIEIGRGRGHGDKQLDPGFALEAFGGVTGGLRLLDIEELFRQSWSRREPISREAVRLRKKRAIAQLGRDLLEVMEPQRGFDAVAGARHAKEYFELIRRPWIEQAQGVPQSILLAGVPGCGKSHLVTALAHELGAPLLVMRNVREEWVGASERNLERVLWVAENLSPCILWTDEVDQVIGQRGTGASGDSGTSERMLGRIFEFFGSMRHRGRILWIATTNRPDILDPALLDRFQTVIPFVHPTREERAALFPLLAEQIGRALDADIDAGKIAALPELAMLTVRALQEILVLAGLRADRRSGSTAAPIDSVALLGAIRDYKPAYNPSEHELIALMSLHMTTFNSLLPWMGQEGLREAAEWPSYLDGLVHRENGTLDIEGLLRRIDELRETRHLEKVMR